MLVSITGELWGRHFSETGEVIGEVIHVLQSFGPNDPAANAFVYAELTLSRAARARYVSWINYYDIEHAGRNQSGRWKIAEPAESWVRKAEWYPYGWDGPILPNVAY